MFAQSELAPRGEQNPDFLRELERTMTLLAFGASSSSFPASSSAASRPPSLPSNAPQSITDLLQPTQRMKTAGELNAAILDSLKQGKEPKLAGLIRLSAWGEDLLEKQGLDFPRLHLGMGLGWDGGLPGASGSEAMENGKLKSA